MSIFHQAIGFLIFSLILNGCTNHAPPDLTRYLWLQTSAEYRAMTIQTYTSARLTLEVALGDKNWTAALEQTGDYQNLKIKSLQRKGVSWQPNIRTTGGTDGSYCPIRNTVPGCRF
jgi:hypothetical protein